MSWPRTYPPAFAFRVAKFYTAWCAEREALTPEMNLQNHSTWEDILSMLSWEGDTWDDAGLRDMFYYLRGSKSLQLGKWRPLFPTTVWRGTLATFIRTCEPKLAWSPCNSEIKSQKAASTQFLTRRSKVVLMLLISSHVGSGWQLVGMHDHLWWTSN